MLIKYELVAIFVLYQKPTFCPKELTVIAQLFPILGCVILASPVHVFEEWLYMEANHLSCVM